MLDTDKQHALTVERFTRLNNSRNGNPTYRVHFAGGAAISTATDAAIAYEISPSSWEGRTFYVRLNKQGRIIDMVPVKLA